MAIPQTDPPTLRFSLRLYRLMLRAYPAAFRREYGPWMLQAFGDAGRDAARRGALLTFWVRTLFDWFKTVIEESLNRDTEMTRPKFVRLSGWGMVLAAVAFSVAMLVDASQFRGSLYRILGPPTTRAAFDRMVNISEAVGVALGLIGVLLLITGVYGLRLRYANPIGSSGRDSLSISILGGWSAFVGILGSPFMESFWVIFVLGLGVQFGGLAAFGIRALRDRIMPRGNILPLAAGAYFPLFLLLSMLLDVFLDISSVELPVWLEAGLVLFSFTSLGLLGLLLTQDSPRLHASG